MPSDDRAVEILAQAAVQRGYLEANQHGWYEYDLATGTIATTPVMLECPPGDADEEQ